MTGAVFSEIFMMKVQILILLVIVGIALVSGAEDQRIVNGLNATEGQFPFHVQIRAIYPIGFQVLCGGTLIHDQFVLTAAHCVKDFKRFLLTFGSVRYDEYWDRDKFKLKSNISFIHPNYTLFPLKNDIALIKLPEKVNFTENIHLINLPLENENRSFVGERVIATGYGRETTNGDNARFLQYAYFDVIGEAECREVYGQRLTPETICAQGRNLESVCFGDSGGPLLNLNQTEIIGITSFGHIDGCEIGTATGFVRVENYLDWINEIIAEEAEPEPEVTTEIEIQTTQEPEQEPSQTTTSVTSENP